MSAPPNPPTRASRDAAAGPPSERASDPGRASTLALPPAESSPPLLAALGGRTLELLIHLGRIGELVAQTFATLARRPFEARATVYQMESLGVRSVGIASITAVFIGMVMAVQFAFGLQKFGGMEYTGRVIGLSFSRELAPTLTAVIVGGRIGSGMAAEVGSMAVTEQIDAIRALGADPLKKLVLPRLLASMFVMPILSAFALVLGFSGAMLVTSSQFNIPAGFFLRTALGSVGMGDFMSGLCKTPFFGLIIAAVGCYFGLHTTGGTEGVGRSTTRSVVVISITILIADFFLTKIFMAIWSQ